MPQHAPALLLLLSGHMPTFGLLSSLLCASPSCGTYENWGKDISDLLCHVIIRSASGFLLHSTAAMISPAAAAVVHAICLCGKTALLMSGCMSYCCHQDPPSSCLLAALPLLMQWRLLLLLPLLLYIFLTAADPRANCPCFSAVVSSTMV